MKQLKILFLGGAYSQIPIIQEAKNRGYYIITCDYLPNNPGHKFADEYHDVSTTDIKGVLLLAQKVNADLIIGYASDPAAPVVAYVSEKLGLPGNSYESVRILSEKDLFRQFMHQHGFNVPQVITLTDNENSKDILNFLTFPYIIKPTDSSGSKGVSKVENVEQIEHAVNYAFGFSRNRRIIAEEYIDNVNGDIHGDGFVIDGELVFSCLGDHIYNKATNPFNPIGTTWPSSKPPEIIKKIESDVARLVKSSGFKNGPINIEARINSEGKHFIMEIGPRSGGHFVPQAIYYATKFDMVKAYLDVLSKKLIILPQKQIQFSAYYAIHSDFEGILKSIKMKQEIQPFIKEFHQYIQLGEKVKPFQGANAAIGVILMVFDNRIKMETILSKIKSFVKITLSNQL